MNNNNKRPNNGRRSNKRKDRGKVIHDNSFPTPNVPKGKKVRDKKLSSQANKNTVGYEHGIWCKLAEMVKEGN